MRTNSIRPAAVAGTWYPGTSGALARDVDGYLEAADAALPPGSLHAIIAPHAGLMFSGPVGAYAYKAAAAAGPFDAILLAGPSHFVAFDGIEILIHVPGERPGRARVPRPRDRGGPDRIGAHGRHPHSR